uniref:Disease resistance family protein n=1 Tax=Populus alba TaxID=43335 RepID=A0A4U5P3T4_POPAL|nr:disease resistance family protein [Populus alba]
MNKVGGISGFVFDTSGEDHLIQRLVKRVLQELRKTPVGIATYTVGLDSRLEKLKMRFTDDKSNRGTRHVQGLILDFEKKNYVRTQKISWVKALNPSSSLDYLIEKRKLFLQQRAEEGELILDTKALKSLVNLRLLQINHAKVKGQFKSFPASLKWLQWKNCPLKKLPSDYAPHELAVLDLSESGIQRVWGWTRNKVAENLMVMNLRRCYNLEASPDLSGCKKLEKLDFKGCIQLTKIHESLGNVRTLLQLNLDECINLVELPRDVSGLRLLQNLILSDCLKLEELPQDIGSMNSLKELVVDKTAISMLPQSLYRLTKLEKLSLNGCKFIKRLPERLGNLIALKELSLNHSAVQELPDSIGSLSNLEKLSLMRCQSLTAIPESIRNLQSLMEVSINSSAIKELPAAIGSLPYLKTFFAGGCHFLSKLPDSIGGLASISELELDGTSISELPEQISGLKMIEKLYLRKCTSLRALPEAIGNILNLTTIYLSGCNITELPESFGRLENLVMLTLDECKKLHKLPVSIGNLKSLCHLLMEKTAVTVLPENFGNLSSLMILKMKKDPLEYLRTQDQLVVFPHSFSKLSLLEELNARAWRISGKIPDDFEKLSSLEILDLGHNNFSSLPSSLCGLSLLRKLLMAHCEELKSLPPLPPSLEELDVSNCFGLEIISDVSGLERLTLLNITNCEKVVDIPGIECLKFLKRLYMSSCKACSLTVKRRLSKVCLRNIRNLSMPGSKFPDWFSQENVVHFSEQNNRAIKAVIVSVVVSLDREIPEDLRYSPLIPDIQAIVLDQNIPIHSTTLYLRGVPKINEDQIHICRYSNIQPLVSMLKDGCKIQVRKRNPPVIEGIQLKKSGILLVFEDDDDYGGNEESLDESQQSVSQKLANFFNSYEEDNQVC